MADFVFIDKIYAGLSDSLLSLVIDKKEGCATNQD
jgi:hypothetical protein